MYHGPHGPHGASAHNKSVRMSWAPWAPWGWGPYFIEVMESGIRIYFFPPRKMNLFSGFGNHL